MKRRWIITLTMVIAMCITVSACSGREAEITEQPEQPEITQPTAVETEEEPSFSPELLHRFTPDNQEDDWPVYSVDFSDDGNLIATGTYTLAQIWDSQTYDLMQAIEMKHSVEEMAFSPDGESLYSAVSLGGVNRYFLSTGELDQEYHGGYDSTLALSHDGELLASGNRNGIAWVWRVSDGELLFELDPGEHLDGYKEYLTALAFSPDGDILAAGYWDGHIFLWDIHDGSLLRIIEPETDYCNAWDLAFSNDSLYLALGGGQRDFKDVVRIFEVADGSIVNELMDIDKTGPRHAPVVYSPDNEYLAAGGVDGIYLWALPDYDFAHFIPLEDQEVSDWVTGLNFSPDSKQLIAGYWEGYSLLWQVQE